MLRALLLASLLLGCSGSHGRADVDARVAEPVDAHRDAPWDDDPLGLVGVSSARPDVLLRRDFGVSREVATLEAPIASLTTSRDGAHALVALDLDAAPVRRLRVVGLRGGLVEARWRGASDHPCAAEAGEIALAPTATLDTVGALFGCRAGAGALALAIIGVDGEAAPVPLARGCRLHGFRAPDALAVSCEGTLRWLSVPTGDELGRLSFDAVVTAGPTLEGPHLVRRGDQHLLVQHAVTGAGSTAAPTPESLDPSTVIISPDRAWAFGRGTTRGSVVLDASTGERAETVRPWTGPCSSPRGLRPRACSSGARPACGSPTRAPPPPCG